MRSISVVTTLACCALAGSAAAQDKGRLFANGSFGVGSLDYSESRTFTQFVEQGRIAADYKNKGKLGGEIGLQYNVLPHLGLMAGYTLSNRDTTGTFTATVPHPFFFNQPRTAQGETSGYSYKENAVFVDLVGTGRSGNWEFDVFGGATFFKIQPDVISEVQYTQTYPYDSITITGAPKSSLSANKTGFNVGAGLDYHAGAHFGFGLQGRFSRAKVTFTPTPGNNLEIEAGGFQAAAGLRLYF
jgi:opacity protein-like surface antigen